MILFAAMIGRLAVAAFFVAYVSAQAPHLVHHVFEHPDEARADCTFLAAAERHHAIPADAVPPIPEPARLSTVAPALSAAPISHDAGSAGARAPPALA
jgi:hypothetical protein